MIAYQGIIQTLLLLATIGLAVFFVGKRKKARAKAGVKIGFLLFLCACVWAILRPDDVTIVAHWVGVSRGTDLLLYVLVIAFMFTTVSSYIRFREQELRYARLARAVALQTAVAPEPETAAPEREAATVPPAHNEPATPHPSQF